jgi:hypothetical protein
VTGIGIGQYVVQEIVTIWGYVKVCAHWLPLAKKGHEEKLIQFMERYPVEVYEFTHRIMTGE